MNKKVKMYEYKRNQVFKNDNLTKKVELLEKEIYSIENETQTILLVDSKGYVKGLYKVDSNTSIKALPTEVELPLDYQAGYYKYDDHKKVFVIDHTKKKEYDEAIIII